MEKPGSEFGKNRAIPDGLSVYCLECNRRRNRAHYRKSREAMGKQVWPREDLGSDQKRCSGCRAVLSVDSFHANSTTKDGRAPYCKECRKEMARRTHLKRSYGITVEDFDRMLEEQGGLCAICREQPAGHVDHDHVTGKVRGLTCFNCNGGLGQFRDRVDIMLSAIDYLERNQTPQWQKTLVSAGVYRITTRPPATAASARSSLPPRPTSFPPV